MKKIIIGLFGLIAATALASANTDIAKTDQITALTCGRLLDVESKQVIEDATVLVNGERITVVEPRLPVPAEAKVIDLSDHTCLPGLMDMHYHPMAFNGLEVMYFKVRSSAEYALVGASNVAKMLDRGFTTLRVPGHPPDPEYALVDLRNAINDGILQGPRLFVAPHSLRSEHTVQTSAYPGWGKERAKNWTVLPGPEGVRDAVRREIANGADWIKIHLDHGGMLGSEITKNFYTNEELQAFVDETHRLKRKIVVGSHGDKASLDAVIAGVDSVDHGLFISNATAEKMKEKGVWLVPTLNIFNDYIYALDPEHSHQLDAFIRESVPAFRQKEKTLRSEDQLRNNSFRYAYKTGVKMANGSDQITVEGALREFSYLVEQGVSRWDAILMGTLNSADLLGHKDKLGSIRVGKYADIIAVKENPLEDITALEKVSFVMKNGQVIRHDRGLDAKRKTNEQQSQ